MLPLYNNGGFTQDRGSLICALGRRPLAILLFASALGLRGLFARRGSGRQMPSLNVPCIHCAYLTDGSPRRLCWRFKFDPRECCADRLVPKRTPHLGARPFHRNTRASAHCYAACYGAKIKHRPKLCHWQVEFNLLRRHSPMRMRLVLQGGCRQDHTSSLVVAILVSDRAGVSARRGPSRALAKISRCRTCS